MDEVKYVFRSDLKSQIKELQEKLTSEQLTNAALVKHQETLNAEIISLRHETISLRNEKLVLKDQLRGVQHDLLAASEVVKVLEITDREIGVPVPRPTTKKVVKRAAAKKRVEKIVPAVSKKATKVVKKKATVKTVKKAAPAKTIKKVTKKPR